MTFDERIAKSSAAFEAQKTQRDSYLEMAEECLVEMTKLQGEYRLLEQLKSEELEPKVEVKNEGKGKK